MKKSNVYTRTGDGGTTSLVGGERVRKSSTRLDSYGTVDELNSVIGLLITYLSNEHDKEICIRIQNHLFSVGGELATAPDSKHTLKSVITEADVEWLEHCIDEAEEGLPGWRGFILPGGCRGAAIAHIARCVCRRAERIICSLTEESNVDQNLMKYINRLSDYFFVLSRKVNAEAGTEENVWGR